MANLPKNHCFCVYWRNKNGLVCVCVCVLTSTSYYFVKVLTWLMSVHICCQSLVKENLLWVDKEAAEWVRLLSAKSQW